MNPLKDSHRYKQFNIQSETPTKVSQIIVLKSTIFTLCHTHCFLIYWCASQCWTWLLGLLLVWLWKQTTDIAQCESLSALLKIQIYIQCSLTDFDWEHLQKSKKNCKHFIWQYGVQVQSCFFLCNVLWLLRRKTDLKGSKSKFLLPCIHFVDP